MKNTVEEGERIVIERSYEAAVEDVWELWTTKEGIESWWGPEGFAVTVHQIDVRPGGVLLYAMSAVQAEMVAFMKQNGMPTTTESKITYTEVAPNRRLAYSHVVDFVPGVASYDVMTTIDLVVKGDRVNLTLTMDRMHDADWSNRAKMGWEQELGKLGRVLEKRKA